MRFSDESVHRFINIVLEDPEPKRQLIQASIQRVFAWTLHVSQHIITSWGMGRQKLSFAVLRLMQILLVELSIPPHIAGKAR